MTIEELQAQIDAMKAEHEAAITGLKSHNDTLLNELKQNKSAAKAAQEAANKAEQERILASNDVEAIKASLTEQFAGQIDELTTRLTASETSRSTLLIDNAMSAHFDRLGVSAQMRKPLAAMFKQSAKLDGDTAKIEDKEIGEYLTQYFKSDEGLHYIAAPNNTGTPTIPIQNRTTEGTAPKGMLGQISERVKE